MTTLPVVPFHLHLMSISRFLFQNLKICDLVIYGQKSKSKTDIELKTEVQKLAINIVLVHLQQVPVRSIQKFSIDTVFSLNTLIPQYVSNDTTCFF
jgi:hypothetical protein